MESSDLYLSDVHAFRSCEALPCQTFSVSRFQLLLKRGKFCVRTGKVGSQVHKRRHEKNRLCDTDCKRARRHLDTPQVSDEGYILYDDDGDLVLERRDTAERCQGTEANSSCEEQKQSGKDSDSDIDDPFSDFKLKQKNKLSLRENISSSELTEHSKCLTGMCMKNATHDDNAIEIKDGQENYPLACIIKEPMNINKDYTTLIKQQDEAVIMSNHDQPSDTMEQSNHPAVEFPDTNSEDEDLEVPRKLLSATLTSNCHEACYINIKHSLATSLHLVGEQVWHGALLLCDYLLHNHEMLRGGSLVDLGAGTGLTSIVAAMFASQVFCTDTGDSILALAQYNTDNARQNSTLPRSLCPVQVRDLDWCRQIQVLDLESQYGLSEEDVTDIQRCSLLLAADVVYDDGLTDAFFTTVQHLLSHPPNKHLYIGLERRLVFTLEDLDVTSPGYNHFRTCLKNLMDRTDNSGNRIDNTGGSTHVLTCEQISTDFPQYFQYNRTEQLELWRVSSHHSNTGL